MFITFEGLDASGKSTQVDRAAKRFAESGKEVLVLREPGGTQLGERIRAILLDPSVEIDPVSELFLFSAARSQLVREVIRPAKNRGLIILCDRFVDSTTAYQGYGRNLPLDSVRAVNRMAIEDDAPDLTFFIDIALDEIERRQRLAGKITDRMEQSGRDFYERTRNGYFELSAVEKRFKIIDGKRSEDLIFNEIWSIIQEELKNQT